MRSLINNSLLLVLVFKLTIKFSNSETIESATHIVCSDCSSDRGDDNDTTNGSNNILCNNNNETIIENNNVSDAVNNGNNVITIESISNNSTIVDSEAVNNETVVSNITNKPGNNNTVLCYFKSWSLYKKGLAKYTPDNINTSLCTHIYYAFASLDNETLTITFNDKNADISKGFYKKITALADKGVKIILSLGGWSDSTSKYSRLVNNATARAKFVNQSIEYLQKYGFQGLDLDWEYPACWQGKCNESLPSDKETFGNLVKELSEAYRPLGFFLSVAVGTSAGLIRRSYDVPVFAKYVDYIGIMTYGMHSYRQKTTGSTSPFLGRTGVVQSLSNWEKAGAPRNKLVVGIPTYAITFQLKNPEIHGMRAATVGPGAAGNYTRAKGNLAYYEICSNIRFENWTAVQTESDGSYAYFDDQWASYIGVKDILQRVEYIKTNGYGGMMVWGLDTDDFQNICGCGANALLTTMRYPDTETPDDCP